MRNIVIFASGNGTNAQRLIEHFRGRRDARIALLVSDNPKAFALQRAQQAGVETLVVKRSQLGTEGFIGELKSRGTGLIVLAGFLGLIPKALIEAFPRRIVNLHPALLPKFGGKGMYGRHVHEAVLDAGERESGITIHLIDEHYDQGVMLLQASTEVLPGDTPESLAERIHALEYECLPICIDSLVPGIEDL